MLSSSASWAKGELCHSWGSASGGTAACNQVCCAPPVLLTVCIHPPEVSNTVIACKLFFFLTSEWWTWKEKHGIFPPPKKSTLQTQERYVLGFLTWYTTFLQLLIQMREPFGSWLFAVHSLLTLQYCPRLPIFLSPLPQIVCSFDSYTFLMYVPVAFSIF